MPDEEGHSGEVRGRPLTVLYLVSSFGFSGSPGEWTPWGRATEEFHRAHRPGLPRRDGALGFDCKILVDDAVLVEPLLGLRPWVSAACYETGVRQMLGKEAVNQEKDAIEGQFKEEQVIWGLTMNAASEKAFLPERRILRGSYLLGDSAFDAGEKCVTVRQVQQFRGITTGWAIVVRGLANELKAATFFSPTMKGVFQLGLENWATRTNAWRWRMPGKTFGACLRFADGCAPGPTGGRRVLAPP